MSEKWLKAISMVSGLPAIKQFESIVRPQACWSGTIQIAKLLLHVIPRLESLAGEHWKTEALRDLCEGLATGHEKIEAWTKVDCLNSEGKVQVSVFPEHGGLRALSHAGGLSETMLNWIAITIICSIHTRDQLDRDTVKNRSAAFSRLDKAWRALRYLPGDFTSHKSESVHNRSLST